MARSRGPNEFTPATRRLLADRVNYMCSVCGRQTSGPRRGHDRAVSIGVAAHIKAARPKGARYDERMTPAQRRDPRNGIWTCQNHGKLVDNDPSRYTVTRLRQLKREAELKALNALEEPRRRPRPRPTRAIRPHPKIVFAQSRGAVIRRWAGGPPIFYVAQLWFRNEPSRGAPVAESLAGYVSLLRNGVRLFPELRAEWAFTNAANNVAFDFETATETLDRLLPNGDYAKLVVLQKRTDDDIAYAWSRGAREYPGRRHRSHEIPPGEYRLEVRIQGLHIDRTFVFRFINPGAGGHPSIEPLDA
jgi:hypothetical protein